MKADLKKEKSCKYINKIMCDDSIKILRDIDKESIHLIFTSPPYNAGHSYENYDDNLEQEEYNNLMKETLKESYRVLVNGGRIAINVPFAVKNKITKSVNFLATKFCGIANEIGFNDFEFITWHKGNDINHFQGNNTAWGSWKSPSHPVFRPLGEVIMVFSKGNVSLKGDKENADISTEEFKNWTKNLWYIDEKNNNAYENLWCVANTKVKKLHPCSFPNELAERVIKLYSYKNNIVLDPFNGIGTTTWVANKLDRNYIGIDISKAYCDIAQERLNNENL